MKTPSEPHQSDPAFARVQLVTIDSDMAGQRIDNFLVARMKGVPRTHIYKMLRKGEIRVNKGRIKADYRLQEADVVRLPPLRVSAKAPVGALSQGLGRLLQQSVLYEDDGLLVLNKPPNLAVHGGSGVSLGLIEALRQLRPEARYLELVHRLDRDTSGCIMVAKKRSFLRYLQQLLRDKSAGKGGIGKRYQALVVGAWPAHKTQINAPLIKLEQSGGLERIVKVHPEGKPSLTRVRRLSVYQQGVSLIEAEPVTGRTHQIRVHAQLQGHPLVGDEKYGDDQMNLAMRMFGVKRLFLHASALNLNLPNGEPLVVAAPLPDDLAQVLNKLTLLESEQ
ncbi:MAG TPA: RluA family pseudouridine synthase [Cellvibrionaceae bacterium]